MAANTVEREEIQAFTIRQEIHIDASIDVAFQAMLDELGTDAQMPDGKTLSMQLEPWPGGRWFRDLGSNAGHLWGHVQVIKPPTLLEIIGPMPMSYPALNHVQYRLKEVNGQTQLTFVHRAMGLIQPDHRDGMPEGWKHWLGRIRESAERRARK